jgi:ubiquinone/menaquinone biosynthesis C-methylase UbiE
MTELELLVDLHSKTWRQGPGSEGDTLRALSLMKLPKDRPLAIADIGCGAGAQTLTLAAQLNGDITAVDIFPVFLEELNRRVNEHDLSAKVTTLSQNMDELPFEDDSLDIVWSEGAIYNMGFENGVKNWKRFLKPGGYLAVSEITWIANDRPAEIENFWMKEYPEIDTAAQKIQILEENGFTLTGYFFLPQDSWTKQYYEPLQQQFSSFLKKHQHSEKAREVVRMHEEEIELYNKYRDYYSYGFYVARKD